MAITEIELFDYLASTNIYATNLIIFYFVGNLLENVHIYGLSCTMVKQNIRMDNLSIYYELFFFIIFFLILVALQLV